MFNFIVPPEDKLSVNKHLIRSIIGKWKNMVRCGPDKLRNEQLKSPYRTSFKRSR
jgi:hypothetical protein